MPWVKLDDQFFVNRKARAVGLEGRALFLASVCYCGMQLNDGTFPVQDVPVIAALADVPPNTAERLFATGLWHLSEDGTETVEVHDYLTWNRSRRQVIAAEEAGRKAALAKHAANRTANRRTNRSAEPSTESDVELENHPRHSSSRNSRGNGQAVDNPDDDVLAAVPDEVWIHYAELMLAKQSVGTISQPAAWKRKTRTNANLEHGDRAAKWWDQYRLTPHQLAECLVDGRAPRGEYRRNPA